MKKTLLILFLAYASLLCGAQAISTYYSTYSVLQGALVPGDDWARDANGLKAAQNVQPLLEYPREFLFERKLPKPKEGEPPQILPMLDYTKPAFEKKEYTFGSVADIWNASADKQFLAIELFGCGPRVPMELVDDLRLAAGDAVASRGRCYVTDAQTVLGREYAGEPVYYGGRRGPFLLNERFLNLYTKGVRYVLSAVVDEYRTHVYKTSEDPKTPPRYESAFSFHVTGYDLDTQEILQTRFFVVRGDGRTLDDADAEALSSAARELKYYVNANFRMTTEIADLGDPNKRDKIKTCTIKAGFAAGAVKGDTYEVCTAGENGKTNHLGRVRITNVLTEELSECNISSGKDKVVEAFDKGIPIVLISE